MTKLLNKRILILLPNTLMLFLAGKVLFREINSEIITKWKVLFSGIGFTIFLILIIIYLIKIKKNTDL